MDLSEPTAPVVDDDGAIRRALGAAQIPPLLAALACATGDRSLLAARFRPDPHQLLDPNGGLPADEQERARQLALEALVQYRDGGSVPAPAPDEPALQEVIEFLVGGSEIGGKEIGGKEMSEYLPLFREELSLEGTDLRAPPWRKDELAPDRPFHVVVIGAGMSGLLAAYRLQQAGVACVVVEKNRDVGGTWLENTYPGCRVDVPNAFYSYSFAQRGDWPQHFSTQDVLLDYFRRCADELGVRPLIRFGTEVVEAIFDEDQRRWVLRLRSAEGDHTLEADAVVSAVGQLNRPLFPDIAGRDLFAGPAFHSARWDHDVDLAGKRVGVIGTGASAVQFIPEIADVAAELVVFQRTPPWLIPTPDYHDRVGDDLRWLFRHVPGYAHWYRLWLFWRNAEGMLPMVTVDPEWEPKDQAVSGPNELLRQLLVAYLAAEFGDDPDLLAQVTPSYPPAAKRVIRDNGIWARTLRRDDVRLVTESIDHVTRSGVCTADGELHEVDVIVYGTGFQASRFLTPMRVVGRGGVELHDRWAGDARAHLGITVPGFPNLFLLYGPNTNIVINGSIIFFSECEVQYLLGCLQLLLERDAAALDVKVDVHDAYNRWVDAGNLERAWGVSTVNSWYRNETGRSAQNWPFTLLEYWQQTRVPDPAAFELL